MYLNDTFSTLKMDNMAHWMQHLRSFPTTRPVVCHAEGQTLAAVLMCAQLAGRAVHICHLATAEEMTLVREAKQKIGSAQRAAAVCTQPVVNAGDGAGEHPTQALLDVFTIRQELSSINGLTIALVGDLKNGRTVHSLAKLLTRYNKITLHYVSPVEELGMPESVCDYVHKHSQMGDRPGETRPAFVQKKFTDLAEGIKGVDVVYMTRVQKERFSDQAEYERVKGAFVLTPKLLDESTQENETTDYNVLGQQSAKPIVMHPLPRVDEISPELDHDDRAAYFRQARNGMFVRMAVLTLLLGRDQDL
ncbi:unnamed protein product, partial [Mesorhabditis spiculigera]